MAYLIGIDGGATRTTVALADLHRREILRREGPAGIVDPRNPTASVDVLHSLIRQTVADAGLSAPAAALCAGLAGVGDPAERETVRTALADTGAAERVKLVCDGEIALEGALRGEAGILLIAGTGSIAYGRGADGRMERCGGWGMMVGDEGSGYAIGRAALVAALRAADGRGADTRLLPVLLRRLRIADLHTIPSWVGRVAKAEVAALVPEVVRLAEEEDAVALGILRGAASELALHAAALVDRLQPWRGAPPVVFFGGVFRTPLFVRLVTDAMMEKVPSGFEVRAPAEDAVEGALRIASALVVSQA